MCSKDLPVNAVQDRIKWNKLFKSNDPTSDRIATEKKKYSVKLQLIFYLELQDGHSQNQNQSEEISNVTHVTSFANFSPTQIILLCFCIYTLSFPIY